MVHGSGAGGRLGELETDPWLVQADALSEDILPALKGINLGSWVDTVGRSEATTRRTSRVGAAEVYPAIGAARFKVTSVSLFMNEIDERCGDDSGLRLELGGELLEQEGNNTGAAEGKRESGALGVRLEEQGEGRGGVAI